MSSKNFCFKPHPLLIPNIIACIIQNFSDVALLANLRLVCRCWNEEVSSFIRRCKTVTFKNEESITAYHRIYQNTQGIFGVFPHENYNFTSIRFQKEKPIFTEFFQTFGNHITTLHLTLRSGCSEPSLVDSILAKVPCISLLGLNFQYFHDKINCDFKFSPETIFNLERVHTLNIQMEGLELSEESSEVFLNLILEHMPNLRKVSYPGDIRRISKVGLFLRDTILDLDPYVSSNLTRLGEWDFKIRLLEEDALKFLCTNYLMRSLHMDLWNPDDDLACISSDLLGGLLRKWDKSLEELSIDFPWHKEVSFHFNFPNPMENLTFLYLGGLEGSLLEILKKLPRLKRLELSQLELFSILPKPDGEEYPNVKQLRLDFCNGQTAGIISRFSRIFPQLRSLNINHATNEVARVIFQKMNKLIRLRMHGHELSDAGMCGFSESTLKEKNLLCMSPTQGNSFRKYNYIADLKELQYLKLDAYALTEVTVRHGLVHCTSLQIVKMDCTGGGSDAATTCRTFKLAEYGKHLVEERKDAVIEFKEDPPLDEEALEFFNSHDKYSSDLTNL